MEGSMNGLGELIQEAVREVGVDVRNFAKEAHPGLDLPEDAAERMSQLMLGIMVAFPDADAAKAFSLVRGLLEMEVEAKESWAIDLLAEIVNATYRPAYDLAIKSGGDPVQVLRATHNLTLKQARAVVKKLQEADAEKSEGETPAPAEGEAAESEPVNSDNVHSTEESLAGAGE